MKFTNLGGACGILEHNGKRILFDPWLDEGIFHGAWHHYPPVKLPVGGIPALGRFDYVYISHIHEDHCSLCTLRQLNPDAELIIMERKPNFVLQFVRKNNLPYKKIHLIPPWSKVRINEDFEVAMMTTDPEHELNFIVDSAIVLEWDGYVIYNSNDCAPYSGSIEFLQRNYTSIDLALIPYATGSSYPSCFNNLTHEHKLKEKSRLFQVGISKFLSTAKKIPAKVVMPFADQYVIVGGKHELNVYMPHPASPGVLRDHYEDSNEQRLLLLNNGQSYELESGDITPDEPFVLYTEEQKNAYAEAHKKDLYDHEKIDFNQGVNLTALMSAASSSYFKRLKDLGISSDTIFIVEATDWAKKFHLDNKNHTLTEVPFHQEDEQPMLKVSVPAGLLILLLIGQVSWNIADAALFIEYTRLPDKYDPLIHSLWNYLKV